MALPGPSIYLLFNLEYKSNPINFRYASKTMDCPICSKQGLLRLENHLANFDQLSSKERQTYLMQAKTFLLDLHALLKELITLRQNTPVKKCPIKCYKYRDTWRISESYRNCRRHLQRSV